MWGAPVVMALSEEPLTREQAKFQCRVDEDETAFDTELDHLISAARAHVEAYCGRYFAEQDIEVQCDRFADMSRLPIAPIGEVASISYIDSDGAKQDVPAESYELLKDPFSPEIRSTAGSSWPPSLPGSRITLSAKVGGDAPADVVHAILLLIGHWFRNHEAVVTGTITAVVPMGVDALLANHRRWS